MGKYQEWLDGKEVKIAREFEAECRKKLVKRPKEGKQP